MPYDSMKTTEQKIKDKEAEIKKLKIQLEEEKDKSEWIYIKELKIKVQTKINHKGKSYDKLKEEFGEEYLEKHLPTYDELQKLRNLEHEGKYNLGLIDSWEFVKQEDLISKKNGYVARFYAYSDYVDLNTVRYSSYSNSYLGVRFVSRNVKSNNKKK